MDRKLISRVFHYNLSANNTYMYQCRQACIVVKGIVIIYVYHRSGWRVQEHGTLPDQRTVLQAKYVLK